jgi:hypothetical protein
MQKRSVDAVVIGAGSAGLNAVAELDKGGADWVLVEAAQYGTTCARVGCMPSKLLVAAADTTALATGDWTRRAAFRYRPPRRRLSPAKESDIMYIRSLSLGCPFLTSVVLGCLLAAAAPALAEDFSWQLSGGASHRDIESFEADTSSIAATFYFDPIDDTEGPYALASFLDPTTRVSAAVTRDDAAPLSYGVIGTVPADEPTAYTVSGRYVWPSTRWYAGASYSKSDVDNEPSPSRRQTDPKSYSVLAGTYLGSNTTLELEVGSSEQRSETQLLCPPIPFCVSVPITVEIETDAVSLDVLHVRQLRSLTYSLYGRISQSDADIDVRVPPIPLQPFKPPPNIAVVGGFDVVPDPVGIDDRLRVYSVAGELFPIPRLGVRLGYSRPDGANVPDGETYDLATTWFFKPHIAVQLALARATQNGFDADIVALTFIGRL